MKKRVIALAAGLAVLAGGLAVRVGVLTRGELASAADRQASYTVTVARCRGTIYDTRLTPLVNTGSEYRISAAPTPQVAAALATQLEGEDKQTALQELAAGHPVALAMDHPPNTVEGIYAFRVPVRYASPLMAEHLVGYLDGDGLHGAVGAEALFDERLSEYTGEVRVTYTLDGSGGLLEGVPPRIENTLSRAAGGVALTLDSRVQAIALRAAKRYLPRGAAVIGEAATGRILASVSTPGFQPDTLAQALEDDDSPLLNRVACNYNCGSVFKIVTAAAALENGLTPGVTFSCDGSIREEGITFHCHNPLGHGRLDMTGGFSNSCNPYFIRLARRTGGRALYDMAAALGFGQALTLEGGWETARSILPAPATLSGAALANLSIGQGDLLASPLHIAAMVGAVVNDGRWRPPSLLKGLVDEKGQLEETALPTEKTVFSAATAARLREMMIQTVQTGTGRSAAPAAGGAGAKTGTAQTGWKRDAGSAEVVQSWIAGFYPAEKPRYVVVTMAEDAENTGGSSADAFRQICEQLASL
ncbi:MAG: peptidoglycan D,D-transpeptidase FtsI family protein [Acutalibacteraceae bacterium]